MLARFRNWFESPQRTIRNPRRTQLGLESLEGREVPSTVSSIAANFNPTAIPAGDVIWFNAAFTASGLSKTAATTIHVENGSINFTAAGTPFHVAVPNGVIVLTPGATSAAASFDPTDNDWDVSAPTGGAGDVFMGGVALPLPNGLPGGAKNVTWTADFWSDTAGVTVSWKWSAAAYKSFGTDPNALNVKPVDNNTLSVYHNGDQSGTPETFKTQVVKGALGGGGTNYTGTFTSSANVKPTVGDGLSDYPYPGSNPLTSVAFNESAVLRAANLDTTNGFFELWYNDEHALALGVRQVIVKTASGTTTTNYSLTAMNSNPGSAIDPVMGAPYTPGLNQSTLIAEGSTDVSGRPMSPALFITDITGNANNRSGDWQWGGSAIMPDAVFGSWKGVVKTIDNTTATPTITVLCDADPVKNNWNLGAGADPAPAGLSNEGYGAEVRWNLADLQSSGLLVPGHTYRFYVMDHDGDQNKSGGDSGQTSFTYYYPGVAAGGTGTIGGNVLLDANQDGEVNFSDHGIGGVSSTSSGQQPWARRSISRFPPTRMGATRSPTFRQEHTP